MPRQKGKGENNESAGQKTKLCGRSRLHRPLRTHLCRCSQSPSCLCLSADRVAFRGRTNLFPYLSERAHAQSRRSSHSMAWRRVSFYGMAALDLCANYEAFMPKCPKALTLSHTCGEKQHVKYARASTCRRALVTSLSTLYLHNVKYRT